MSDKPKIDLSEESVKEVRLLCNQILTLQRKNEKTVSMANGIANFAEANRYISPKQAHWVCHNADFCKLKRPTDLQNFDLDTLSFNSDDDAPEVDVGLQDLRGVIDTLAALERKIAAGGRF